MEPTNNPNVTRTQRRTFYNFTRRYGEQIQLSKVSSSSVDYTTGDLSRSLETTTIRNAVYVPPTRQNRVIYTPSMMQAIRQYAWQGGAGQNIEETMFLISQRDIRNWGEIEATQTVIHRGKTYDVKSVQTFDGGVIISGVETKGTHGS
jgi:hypothetical protein